MPIFYILFVAAFMLYIQMSGCNRDQKANKAKDRKISWLLCKVKFADLYSKLICKSRTCEVFCMVLVVMVLKK